MFIYTNEIIATLILNYIKNYDLSVLSIIFSPILSHMPTKYIQQSRFYWYIRIAKNYKQRKQNDYSLTSSD